MADAVVRGRSWSRVIGHVGWWVFVVSALFAMAAEAAAGPTGPRRYADYLPADAGWTAYSPGEAPGAESLGRPWRGPLFDDPIVAGNVCATVALVAIVVVVLAAVAEAIAGRQPGAAGVRRAVVTVAAPILGGTLVALGATGGVGGLPLRWPLLFALVLAGIAVREAGGAAAARPGA